MRYSVALESKIATWLLFGDKVHIPKYARMIAERVYPKELKLLRNKVCPWCGRQFNSRRTLKLHLNAFRSHTSCSFAFNSMVRDIANTYMKVRTINNEERVMKMIASA